VEREKKHKGKGRKGRGKEHFEIQQLPGKGLSQKICRERRGQREGILRKSQLEGTLYQKIVVQKVAKHVTLLGP